MTIRNGFKIRKTEEKNKNKKWKNRKNNQSSCDYNFSIKRFHMWVLRATLCDE